MDGREGQCLVLTPFPASPLLKQSRGCVFLVWALLFQVPRVAKRLETQCVPSVAQRDPGKGCKWIEGKSSVPSAKPLFPCLVMQLLGSALGFTGGNAHKSMFVYLFIYIYMHAYRCAQNVHLHPSRVHKHIQRDVFFCPPPRTAGNAEF